MTEGRKYQILKAFDESVDWYIETPHSNEIIKSQDIFTLLLAGVVENCQPNFLKFGWCSLQNIFYK